MKKAKFPITLVLGAALIAVGLSLLVVTQIRSHIGFQNAKAVVSQMNEILPDAGRGDSVLYTGGSMPALQIDGTDYVAKLEIAACDVNLPVADEWSKNKLFKAPARFSGSAYENSMVIGGADYPHQFAFCGKIENGTVVKLTDMTGAIFTYEVKRVDRSKKAQSKWLTDADCDMTLFCRDFYSGEYIAVRCDLTYNK